MDFRKDRLPWKTKLTVSVNHEKNRFTNIFNCNFINDGLFKQN